MRAHGLGCCVALGLLAAGMASCRESEPRKPRGESSPAEGSRAEPMKVFVSIPPQAWLVERIGGPQVAVEVLIGANQDPHTFVATPRQISELNRAAVFFAVGLPLERPLVEKLPRDIRVVDVGSKLATLAEAEHDHHPDGEAEHEHAAEGHAEDEHEGEARDPHVWLSLRNLVTMAEAIRDELVRLDPELQTGYEVRCAAVVSELEALDARLSAALAPLRGRRFYVYHAAFGYFARDYGLVQTAVEVGGKSPSGRQLAALIERAKADGVKIIFVQKQFAATSGAALAEAVGAAVVTMDPLARDVAANFAEMAAKMERGVGGGVNGEL